ncbi:hypothetical protein TIFTF001_039601 [Ficus carica]|uniref:Cytochrome P450 n=1 Tax=Ficus carica TaxID=3494 RepID=A0AA88E9G4_FICCA|nr:hypothetical protein TIFTF001_039601 [Ficus carica]
MLRNSPAHWWIHRVMKQLNTNIACFHLGNTHVIVVDSPEIAREFLKKHDAIFASRPETKAACILSRGYRTTAFGLGGEQWKKMRRILCNDPSSTDQFSSENGSFGLKFIFRPNACILPQPSESGA